MKSKFTLFFLLLYFINVANITAQNSDDRLKIPVRTPYLSGNTLIFDVGESFYTEKYKIDWDALYLCSGIFAMGEEIGTHDGSTDNFYFYHKNESEWGIVIRGYKLTPYCAEYISIYLNPKTEDGIFLDLMDAAPIPFLIGKETIVNSMFKIGHLSPDFINNERYDYVNPVVTVGHPTKGLMQFTIAIENKTYRESAYVNIYLSDDLIIDKYDINISSEPIRLNNHVYLIKKLFDTHYSFPSTYLGAKNVVVEISDKSHYEHYQNYDTRRGENIKSLGIYYFKASGVNAYVASKSNIVIEVPEEYIGCTATIIDPITLSQKRVSLLNKETYVPTSQTNRSSAKFLIIKIDHKGKTISNFKLAK